MRILSAVKTSFEDPPGSRNRHSTATAVCTLLLAATTSFAAAQSSPDPTTVVFFSDHPLQPAQWNGLFAALRTGLASGDKEIAELDRNPGLIVGDESLLSLDVNTAVTVYLHGDCTLEPMEHRTAYAVPLGWVRRIDGEIQPFVHVDCTRVAQTIGDQARWLSRAARDRAMAGAMAQVILHEWIHIATQSAGHTAKGIAKAQFGPEDLMNGSAVPAPRGGGK